MNGDFMEKKYKSEMKRMRLCVNQIGSNKGL